MKTTLEDTGERMIPEHHKGKNIYGAHFGRYQAGLSLVKDKVVLDIACGSGYGTKLMASRAKQVYGVDVDRDTIAYAQQHFGGANISYVLGDGEAIPLEDASVDVVVSYETIEHIAGYRKFMQEVKRVLKPGGLLLLSTPNDVEYAEGNHFHLHEFTYGELKKLVGAYFKYHTDYFQTLWLYSSIVPEKLLTSEWELPIKTTNTVALQPEQCIYFFMLCSDKKIQGTIEPQGIIGEHFRQRDLQARNEKYKALITKAQKLEIHTEHLAKKATRLEARLSEITSSRAWKTTRLLQKGKHRLRHPLATRKGK